MICLKIAMRHFIAPSLCESRGLAGTEFGIKGQDPLIHNTHKCQLDFTYNSFEDHGDLTVPWSISSGSHSCLFLTCKAQLNHQRGSVSL